MKDKINISTHEKDLHENFSCNCELTIVNIVENYLNQKCIHKLIHKSVIQSSVASVKIVKTYVEDKVNLCGHMKLNN